jgi:hypothetical protein
MVGQGPPAWGAVVQNSGERAGGQGGQHDGRVRAGSVTSPVKQRKGFPRSTLIQERTEERNIEIYVAGASLLR